MSPDDTFMLDMLDGVPQLIFWFTDSEGTIVHSVGGALRPIGLVRDATAGRHVREFGETTAARFVQAMDGYSSMEREFGSWEPAKRRRYVTAWGPYYKRSKICGMVTIAFDVSDLDPVALEQIQATLATALPTLMALAKLEAERLTREADQALRTASAEDARRERADEWWNLTRWSARQLVERLGIPVSILATAVAMWAASRLGVLEEVARIVGW